MMHGQQNVKCLDVIRDTASVSASQIL